MDQLDAIAFLPISDEWKTMIYVDMFALGLMLIAVVLQVIAVVQIFQRKSTFLRFEQLMWFTGIIASLIMVASINFVGFEYFDEDLPTMIGSIVGSVVGMLLWTLYFCKSVRVHTYMGGDEFKDKALFAFNKTNIQ
jgi:hypothetical protein